MRRALLLALLVVLGAAAPAAAQLPIFDAHIHYSRPDWEVYTPERALSILAAAGVRRAIVSSTPDDGTLKLYEKAPKGVVPFLRPYRTRDDMGRAGPTTPACRPTSRSGSSAGSTGASASSTWASPT